MGVEGTEEEVKEDLFWEEGERSRTSAYCFVLAASCRQGVGLASYPNTSYSPTHSWEHVVKKKIPAGKVGGCGRGLASHYIQALCPYVLGTGHNKSHYF